LKLKIENNGSAHCGRSRREGLKMPKLWERQEKAVAELAKVINLKSPCWGVKIHDWKLAWEKEQPLTVNLLAEINQTQFNAPFSIILKTNKIVFENTDYISYPLRYSTLENRPELAAIPTTAFLLGHYLTKVTPIPPTSMCLYPSLSEAYMNILWECRERPTEPGLSVKVLVKERDHLLVVTYQPESWSYKNSVEIETDIYDAPQVVKAGLALCAL
jgi:hypothetical protein